MLEKIIEKAKNNKNIGYRIKTKIGKIIGGLHRGEIITVGAEPKVGKTAFVDYVFLVSLLLENENKLDNISIVYYSYEISLENKLAKLSAMLLKELYGEEYIIKDNKAYRITDRLILGKQLDGKGKLVWLNEKQEELLREIDRKYLDKWFKNNIEFIVDRENPTGIYKYLFSKASKEGRFLYDEYEVSGEKKKRIVGYIPNNPHKLNLVIIDHIRKVPLERGFTQKQNIDKISEYEVVLRDLIGYSFINIAHLNRNLSNVERIKFQGKNIYPIGSDFKDSGNLSEDSNLVITLFNPEDDKYGLNNHFGIPVNKDKIGFRTVHIIESRDTEAPIHMAYLFDGASGVWSDYKIKKEDKQKKLKI